MRAIKVDSNRNPIIKNGMFEWVYNIDVIAQNCDQAMRQQLGELSYAADKGIDYFGNVYTGAPNFQRFEAQARIQLLNVEGVTGINSFTYELDYSQSENVLNYSADIATIYGSVVVDDSKDETINQMELNEIAQAVIAAQRYVNAGVNYANIFQI